MNLKKQNIFKIDHNFPKVIGYVKTLKKKENNTWINNIILDTFIELHKIEKCHSVECYEGEKLIGGLYGFTFRFMFFFGESMFSLKTNTSKFCLLYLLAILKKYNFSVLDSQF